MARIFDYIANKGSLYSETGVLGVVTGGLLHTKCNKGWMLPCTGSKYITFTLSSLQQKATITVTKVNNIYTVTQTNTAATITSLVLNNANYLRYIIYDTVASATSDLKNIQSWINTLQPLTYQKRLLQLPKPTELKQSGIIAGYNKIRNGVYNDLSVSGKHGVVTNCLSTVKGIKLHGINSKVVLGNIGNVKSISFRIKLKTTTQPILEKASNSGLIHVSGGVLTSLDFANKYINGVAGTAITANQWHNVTLTSSTDVAFTVTTLGLNNTTYGNFEIEDLRFYSTALSLQEIKAYHNSFNEVILHEKFEDMAVGSSKLPNGWIKNGGSFVCGEIPKKLQVGEILTNNDLSNWSGSFPYEIPDGWVAFGTHGVNNYVTQSPIGQCRIYTTGAGVGINKTCLTTGRYYKLTFDLLSISGTMEITGLINGVFTPTTITTGTKVMYGEATSSILVFKRGSACDFTIDNIYLEEIYPLNYKVGTKYLKCVTAGIVAMPCKWVNGTTKINLFKVGNTVNDWLFTSTVIGTFNATGQNGYLLRWDTDNKFKLYKITNGVLSAALITSVNTYPPSWYEPTVTRTTSGVFTVYINGVSIGTATDTTFNTSNYNQHSCIANDRITNINIQSQIKA